MNSNNLLTTVFRNFQCARRNRGYWPTMYMMLEAMMALLSLPLFCSHRPSKSCRSHGHIIIGLILQFKTLESILRFLHLNYSDEEPFLIFFVHGSTDGTNGPAQRVKVLPGPLSTIHLIMKLFCHNTLCISIVQMGKIDYRERNIMINTVYWPKQISIYNIRE